MHKGGGDVIVDSTVPFCFSITDFSLCPPGPLAVPYMSWSSAQGCLHCRCTFAYRIVINFISTIIIVHIPHLLYLCNTIDWTINLIIWASRATRPIWFIFCVLKTWIFLHNNFICTNNMNEANLSVNIDKIRNYDHILSLLVTVKSG